MQVVYFIKHMTAYEMRISDWSSDVCTSDLSSLKCCSTSIGNACIQFGCAVWPIGLVPGRLGCSCMPNKSSRETTIKGLGALATKPRMASRGTSVGGLAGARSEEHTSEPQSLMRISYAVFCLKINRPPHTRRQIRSGLERHT